MALTIAETVATTTRDVHSRAVSLVRRVRSPERRGGKAQARAPFAVAVARLRHPSRPRVDAEDYIWMTPVQELFNALTMLLPTSAVAHAAFTAPAHSGALIVALAVMAHLPFSLAYHTACALRPAVHPVKGNCLCQGDLIAIHGAGALLSLALSGSWPYFLLCLAFNTACALRIATWASGRLERRLCRLVCVLLYVAPVAATVGLLEALEATVWFMAVSVPFALNAKLLGGWGHALSHIALVWFTRCLLDASAGVAMPFDLPGPVIRGLQVPAGALLGNWTALGEAAGGLLAAGDAAGTLLAPHLLDLVRL